MSDLDLTEAVKAAARGVTDSMQGRTWRSRSPLDVARASVAAAAPLIEAQVRAQIAAEAVAPDLDDAHRLLRDFAGGCGDAACLICVGDS